MKNSSQNFFDFFLTLIYVIFQCGRYNIFKKILNLYFAHENLKNKPQKLVIIGPNFFSSAGPAAQTSPELIFHIINIPKTHLSPYLWSHPHFECYYFRPILVSVFFPTECGNTNYRQLSYHFQIQLHGRFSQK